MRLYSCCLRLAEAGVLALVCNLVCEPALAGPRAYITSCCGGGTSVSFLDNRSNSETGFLAHVFAGAIAFSPDSKTAYLASRGSIHIVDVATRKVTGSFADPLGPQAIAIAPNGGTAYVAEIGPGNGTVTAFSLPQGKVIARITIVQSYQCTDIKLAPDGTKVYVACQQTPLEAPGHNYFTVIDASQNQVVTTIQTRGGGNNSFLAISPDGAEAYMTVAGKHIAGYAIIDLSTVTVTATRSLPTNSNGLAIAPDGSVLYSSGRDEVYAVTPATGRVLQKIEVPSGPAGLAVTPDGTRLYVADYWHNEVSVVDLATGKITATVPTGGGPSVVTISPDGATTLSGNSASTVVDVADASTGRLIGAFEGGSYPAGLALSPDGSRAFVVDQGPGGYGRGGVMVIDTGNFKRLAQIHVAGAATIAILPNGSTVYCGANQAVPANNGTIAVIDPSSYKVSGNIMLGTIEASNPNLAVSPDGSKLYAAYTDISGQNTLAVISTSSNTVTQTILLGAGASFAGPFVALSPDGTRAYVTLTNASQLAVVDTTQNVLLTTVSIAPKYPVSLAVHPNGKLAYLVSSLGFNGIVVFDLISNIVTGTVTAPGFPVPFNVAFTPDGSKAYMTEELGPALVIDTASQMVVGRLPVGNSNSQGVTISTH